MSSSFKKRIIRELVVKGRYAQGVKILGEKRLKMFLKVWIADVKETAEGYPKDTVTSLIQNVWSNPTWMFSMNIRPNQSGVGKDRTKLFNGITK